MKKTKRPVLLTVTATLALAAGLLAPQPAGSLPDSTGVTTRESVKTGGAQSDALGPAAAGEPSVSSADGRYVAFTSEASNLVPGDTNGATDVFVKDTQTDTLTRASVGPSGVEGDGRSDSPSISADGQFVAFRSDATNLVTGDKNDLSDVFVRDLVAGTTVRVSVGAGGVEGDGPSQEPSISTAFPNLVAFSSDAKNFVTGDGNNTTDVFVHDSGGGGTTTLMSAVASGAAPATGTSVMPAISANGKFVAFASDARDLDSGDTQDFFDVFVRDRTANSTTRVSVSSGDVKGDGDSFRPSISDDGTRIAFESAAKNLVAGDTNGFTDVFVRGPGTATARASVATGGAEAHNGDSFDASLSGDGNTVAFQSGATDLVSGDTNNASDVFVHVLLGSPSSQATNRVSVGAGGAQLTKPSQQPAIAVIGTTLVVAYANGPIDPGNPFFPGPGSDVFKFVRVSSGESTTRVSAPGSGEPVGPAQSSFPALSGDGRFVAFTSSATDLVPDDTNGVSDIFVHDRQTNTTTRVSVGPGGVQGDGPSLSFPFLSGDGRYVTFSSNATNLVAGGDTNGATDVFVHDRQTGTTTLVSAGLDGAPGQNGSSTLPFISADGNFVAFASDATNLVTGDNNGVTDVFIRDLKAKTTTRVSVAPGGAEADQPSTSPSLSADGRLVAFNSVATNLVTGDTNGMADAFVYDRETAITTRVSGGSGAAEANGQTGYPIVSGNGRYVAFASNATNLVTGDTNKTADVFVYDRTGATTERVSVGPAGMEGDQPSDAPWISADGRFVAFDSGATNLVPGDTNNEVDAFVRDRRLGTTTRVSVGAGGQSNGSSLFPTLSADGRYVSFESQATNLVIGDTNKATDIFVHDRTPIRGYWLAASDGGVFTYGDAPYQGSTGNIKLNRPIVGMGASPTGTGYWLVASDGGLFAFGSAKFQGSTGAMKLNKPIVGMAATPTGGGYWLVASDGGVFAFGDAKFQGSTGAMKLNQPVVGMAATPTGGGYWLVASDGGIFAFGDAVFAGSTGAIKLNKPIVGMAATSSGDGYWLVASDGGIFAFGDARFQGSTGAIKLNQPIVGMSPSATGGGYWLVASDGGIFAFGDGTFFGSAGAIKLNNPIVGMGAR